MSIEFKNGTCLIEGFTYMSDFAMLYYPKSVESRNAIRKFKEEISKIPSLMESLKKNGYGPRKDVLTPIQQQLIIERIGPPSISINLEKDMNQSQSI